MNTIWLSKNIVIQNITEKISSKIINVNESFTSVCCSIPTLTGLSVCKNSVSRTLPFAQHDIDMWASYLFFQCYIIHRFTRVRASATSTFAIPLCGVLLGNIYPQHSQSMRRPIAVRHARSTVFDPLQGTRTCGAESSRKNALSQSTWELSCVSEHRWKWIEKLLRWWWGSSEYRTLKHSSQLLKTWSFDADGTYAHTIEVQRVSTIYRFSSSPSHTRRLLCCASTRDEK